MSAFRRAFVVATIGWGLLLPVAPFAAQPAHGRAWYALAFLVYGIGSVVCHQLPERSFELWSAQMPVCARCTGIYAGAAATAAFFALRFGRTPLQPGEWSHSARHYRYFLAVAALPTAVTLVLEWTTGPTPSNVIRAAAGLPLGVAVVVVILSALRGPERPPPAPPEVHAKVN